MKYLFLLLLLSSCAGTRLSQKESERAVSNYYAAHPEAQRSISHAPIDRGASAALPPAKAGVLSGIGKVFSTPEGTARRHAVKLAKASVPKKVGKGAVYAPKATEVVNAYKPKSAVVKADSGAIVTTIGKNKAPAATAPNATATSTESTGISWWWLLVPAAGVALYLYRKTLPFLG